MIQITPQMRLLLAVEPVDFRKGIDGLVQVCRQRLNTDPIVSLRQTCAGTRRASGRDSGRMVFCGRGSSNLRR